MVATENAQRVIDMALQMHGGLGVKVGTKVESLYRDIRSLRIYEGATEVQQLIIGKSVLKQLGTELAAAPPRSVPQVSGLSGTELEAAPPRSVPQVSAVPGATP